MTLPRADFPHEGEKDDLKVEMSRKVHQRKPRISPYRPRQSERGQESGVRFSKSPGTAARRFVSISWCLKPVYDLEGTDFGCAFRPSAAASSWDVPHLKKKNPSSAPAPVADSTAAGLVVKVEFWAAA